MTSGDGGALLTNDQDLKQKAFSFHSASAGKIPFYAELRGLNLRLTEFQAAVAAVQMTRLEEQAKIRTKNAEYLVSAASRSMFWRSASRNGWAHLA